MDFQLPNNWNGFTDLHHIAAYYLVNKIGGELCEPLQFDGQDSLGAVWVSEEDVSVDNASPLVLKAFDWLKTNTLGFDAECYKEWKVYK